MMPVPRFRKRQRFSHRAGVALPQGIVPAFTMSGLSALCAHAVMRISGKHRGIGSPEVTKALTPTIRLWQLIPEMPAGLFAPIAESIRDQEFCPPAFDRPQPCVINAAANTGTAFIHFQDIGRLGGRKRLAKGGASHGLFLSTWRRFDAPRQKCAPDRGDWNVLDRRAGFARAAPRNTGAVGRECPTVDRRYRGIAVVRREYARF